LNLLYFRLPVPNYVPYRSNRLSFNMHLLIPRGFSANLVLVIWCLFGGVCQWGFEENIRALMFKQVFEVPVDTAQDVLDRGLIPVVDARSSFWLDHLAHSDNPVYKQLAKITVMPKDWDEVLRILEHGVQGAGTHVYMSNWPVDKFGYHHLSQEKIEGSNPYVGWIVNKKWHLNEELAKHILIYQQVCGILFLLFWSIILL
jgi:hypothetical protein